MRNKRINGIREVQQHYGFTDDEMSYLTQTIGGSNFHDSSATFDVDIPKNGDLSMAHTRHTGELLKDTTLASYLMQCKSSKLLNFNMTSHPNVVNTMDICVAQKMLSNDGSASLQTIEGGFSDLIARIVSSLSSMASVELCLNRRVNSINEVGDAFSVMSANTEDKVTDYNSCKQLIYACGIQGLEYIGFSRWREIRELTMNVRKMEGFKLFLTYENAWWEQHGLHNGVILTDLPNWLTMAFGEDGKSSTHATLLVSFTNKNILMLESLDYKNLERFKNKEGNVPEELTPSQTLVDFMQGQLQLMLGKQFKFRAL